MDNNVVTIQLTLNDEELRKLLLGNISELPKEKLQDVLCQSIKEVLTSEDGKKLFITKDGYYSNPSPSQWLKKLAATADVSRAIGPVLDEVLADFGHHYPEILERCLKEAITDMFVSQFNRSQLEHAWEHATEGQS